MFSREVNGSVTSLMIKQDSGPIRQLSVKTGNLTPRYLEWLEELASDFDNRIKIHSHKPIPDIMRIEDGELVFSLRILSHANIPQLYDCESRELIITTNSINKNIQTTTHHVWPVVLQDVMTLIEHAKYVIEKAGNRNIIHYDLDGAVLKGRKKPSYRHQDDLKAICHKHLSPLNVRINSVIWDGDYREELVFDHLECDTCRYPTRCKYGNVCKMETSHFCAEMFLCVYGYRTYDSDGPHVTIQAPIVSAIPHHSQRQYDNILPKNASWEGVFCVIGSNIDHDTIPPCAYQLCCVPHEYGYGTQHGDVLKVVFKDPHDDKYVAFETLSEEGRMAFPSIYLGDIQVSRSYRRILEAIPEFYLGDLFVNKYDWDTRENNDLGKFKNHWAVNESAFQYHLRYGNRAKSARK